MVSSYRVASVLLVLVGTLAHAQPLTDRHGDPLPAGATARLGTSRFRHASTVQTLTFSPDGKTLASGGYDGVVCLWESATGKLTRSLPKYQNFAIHLAYSPDGSVLLTGDAEEVTLWEAASGRLRHRLAYKGKANPAFSADGKSLAVEDGEKVRILDAATGKERRAFAVKPDNGERRLALSPNGGLLIIVRGNVAFLYDLSTGKKLRTYMAENDVESVAFAPNGKTLATGDSHGQVIVWETDSEDEKLSFTTGRAEVVRLSYADGGKVLVVLGRDGVVSRWDAATGKELGTAGKKDDEGSYPRALSADGKRLAVATDSLIRVRDLATGKETPDLGQVGPLYRAAWSPAGGLVALEVRESSQLLLWEPGKEPRGLTAPVNCHFAACLPPDGKLVASAAPEGRIKLWDAATGKEVREMDLGAATLFPLDFSPDGRSLSVWADAAIVLLDPVTGKERLSFKEIGPADLKAAFTPDSRSLVIWPRDKTLRVLELATGKERARIRVQQDVYTLAVSPDGTAVLGGHNEWRLYDLGKGEVVRRVSGDFGAVEAAAFSPGGKLLATAGSMDQGVRLWDPSDGRQLRRLTGHRTGVASVAFSPDGKFLVSAGWDGTALIWDVAAVLAVREPPAPAAEVRSPAELWADLADADAAKAYAAIHSLAARPKEALPLLRERLRPVVAPDPKAVARLVADLDSDRFETRDRATKELQALDKLAAPALRKALEEKPSPELKRAVEALLDRLDGEPTDPVWLREKRAVEALEVMGTPDARRLLDGLAAGAAGARRTDEAKAAATRLTRRAALPR